MYGSVAKTRVKPENREKMTALIERHLGAGIPGYMTSHALWQNDSDVCWMFTIFEDRESYERNAGDPAQHARYVEYRALMEDEPEWHDGEIVTN